MFQTKISATVRPTPREPQSARSTKLSPRSPQATPRTLERHRGSIENTATEGRGSRGEWLWQDHFWLYWLTYNHIWDWSLNHSSCLICHAVFSCLFKMIPFLASSGPPMAGAFKRCFLWIHTVLFWKLVETGENMVKDSRIVKRLKGFEKFWRVSACFAYRRNIEPSEFRRFYDRNDLPIQVHGPAWTASSPCETVRCDVFEDVWSIAASSPRKVVV